jgi:hypothetical protein
MMSVHFYFLGDFNTYSDLCFNISVAFALNTRTLYLVCLIEAVRPAFQADLPKNTSKGLKVNNPA